jgi:hypothetical protein
MKKFAVIGMIAVLATVVFGSAVPAQATPGQRQICTTCHSTTSAIKVKVTRTSRNHYKISAPGARGIGVFYKGTKVASATGSSMKLKTAKGRTYTILAVNGYPTGAKKSTFSAK